MKKIIIFLFIIINSLNALVVNEYANDVYFANGINTDEKTAKKSRDTLSGWGVGWGGWGVSRYLKIP